MAPRTVAELLDAARRRLDRVGPSEATEAMAAGAALVDIRSDTQRERDGVVPGSIVVNRNELEWRADPASDYRDPRIADPERRLIVMCNEGYQSSLAAAMLQDLGLEQATDLDGGFQAWRAAGLPVEPEPSE
jgi:rhodanese-related sulfurtransferase